ncbi:MAG: membrane fusion protein (multidrug efflux system) [Lentimonas sp.]|jgi:membrane fusion protein (multidrug efflux system)
MKKGIGILILIALLALIVVQLMGNKEISENRVYQYDKEQEIGVHTEKVQLAYGEENHSFTGTFEAFKEVKINADVQGKIVKMYVDEAATVKKGQNLIKLDDKLLILQLQTIEAQIEALDSDVKRYIILSEADAIQGVQLEKTLFGLKTAKIQRKTLLETIEKTTIKAPFSGIVTKKMTEIGAFAAPGVPLIMLTDISSLKFTVNVSENDLSLFEMNQTYNLKADLFTDLELKGEVVLIGSKGNVGNSFPVHFKLENTTNTAIKAKMFGQVSVKVSGGDKSILIPSSAIIGSNIQPQVYLVKNGKAILQKVSISRRIGNKAAVESGVAEGDEIVTSGFINLFDGANVINSKN